jgi:hypothetical protein
VVLPWCCSGVTVALQWCYSGDRHCLLVRGVAGVFNCDASRVSTESQQSISRVSAKRQQSVRKVSVHFGIKMSAECHLHDTCFACFACACNTATTRFAAFVSSLRSLTCGVTVVLQWCHSGITVVLQWCSGEDPVVKWCYSGVTVVLEFVSPCVALRM